MLNLRFTGKASCIGIVFLLIALFSNCSEKKSTSKEEGEIEFATKAINPDHPLNKYVPKTVSFKFKGYRSVYQLSTMGFFRTAIILDSKAKTLTQIVSFLSTNKACIENEKEVAGQNASYVLNIEETNETKLIAGLTCFKANVTKANAPGESFEVWYTKDLGMEDVNALTPYAAIKGVLLDYRLEKMGIEMHFTATSYKDVRVPDNAFEIPAGIPVVSKEEFESSMNKFIDR